MTQAMPEINALIKRLKLSHVDNHLQQRTRESIDKKLSYLEFLSLVLQDEILKASILILILKSIAHTFKNSLHANLFMTGPLS